MKLNTATKLNESNPGQLSDIHMHILKAALKHGSPKIERSALIEHVGQTMPESPGASAIQDGITNLQKAGHLQGFAGVSGHQTYYSPTPKGKTALLAHIKADPMNAVKLADDDGFAKRQALRDKNYAALKNWKPSGPLGDVHYHILKGLVKDGPMDGSSITRLVHNRMAGAGYPHTYSYSDPHEVSGHLTDLEMRGHISSGEGSGKKYTATPQGKAALLAHIKADPMNAVKLSALPGKVNNMPTKSTEALMLRVAQMDAEEQTRFVTALGDKHGLPAVALTAVDAIFKAGQSTAVQLGDAIDAYNTTVALSEPGESPEMPAALADADLSDMVLVSRAALREMVETVAASGRTEVQLADTTVVEGAPADGKGKTILSQVAAIEDPRAAAKELDRLVAEGKLTPSRS